jgi:hypothetical protein
MKLIGDDQLPREWDRCGFFLPAPSSQYCWRNPISEVFNNAIGAGVILWILSHCTEIIVCDRFRKFARGMKHVLRSFYPIEKTFDRSFTVRVTLTIPFAFTVTGKTIFSK